MKMLFRILILVPIAIVAIALSVANRQTVTFSLDPFSQDAPLLAIDVPLFVLIFAAVLFGVLAGGVAAWFRQGKWRKAARRAVGEAAEWRSEAERMRRAAPGKAPAPAQALPSPDARS
jgi:uncharacterized integral membrane protein